VSKVFYEGLLARFRVTIEWPQAVSAVEGADPSEENE
jgi:hypothetical protein